MTIILSICIPTYNRAQFLTTALESVISQANDEVEIVISDNASTDSTKSLIDKFRKRFSRITYFRQSENIGFDRNILKAVELAKGHYCWLLGSDDAICPDAIQKMFSLLDDGDVYVVDRINMLYDFSKVLAEERMINSKPGQKYICSNQVDILRFFEDANSIGGMFSYISSLVVRKSLWEKVGLREKFIGSGYIHVSKLFSIVSQGATIINVGVPLVMNRTGNDELLRTVGYTKRRLVDLSFGIIAIDIFKGRTPIIDKIIHRLAIQFFNIRVLLTDKRNSFIADGQNGCDQLSCQYELLFKNEPFYRLKIFTFIFINHSILKYIKYLFGKNKS